MQGLCVPTCTSEPRRDGGLAIAEDPFGGRSVQPFGQRREHHADLGRGGFQTIQGSVASGSECGVAGLTTKRLDPLSLAMSAITDQGVDVSVCDPGVRALRVGTSEALSIDPLGGSPAAFHFAPGSHRRRQWLSPRRGGGKTTGGTIVWGTGLEETMELGT
ncbi:hypothetical protein KSC_106190 [Ktedonobacter sp. SOSP1-52]|nr:hypothetical protein KSC_106190 [Ktedonobacter sp. SOSP1-52]